MIYLTLGVYIGYVFSIIIDSTIKLYIVNLRRFLSIKINLENETPFGLFKNEDLIPSI